MFYFTITQNLSFLCKLRAVSFATHLYLRCMVDVGALRSTDDSNLEVYTRLRCPTLLRTKFRDHDQINPSIGRARSSQIRAGTEGSVRKDQ